MPLTSWEEVAKFQSDVAKIMINSQHLNRIAHAYIFEGPNGTKKKSTAFLLAKTLLCTNPSGHNPCNVCHNCRRIDHETHPHVFYIKPKGKVIRKEQIQELIKEFSKASIEKGPRIYIIEDADRFNLYSANTLLKTMEEPGTDIYQVLLTENYNALLKTIVSRAETIHFTPIDRQIIRDQLIENDISFNIANAVSEYTVDMGMAIKIAKDTEMINIISLVAEIHKTLLQKHLSSVILFREQADKIFNNPEMIDFFLTLLIFYQKDILNMQLRNPGYLCFQDEEETIKTLSETVSQQAVEDNIDKMLGLKSSLKYNINHKLAFDEMLAHLERGFKHET